MKFALIILCGLLAIATSCEKSKNRSGTYSCTETHSNYSDSSYQRSYEIDHYKRKSMNIYITEHHAVKLDYSEPVVYRYSSVSDPFYMSSTRVTFVQDSMYVVRSTYDEGSLPSSTTILADCLLDE